MNTNRGGGNRRGGTPRKFNKNNNREDNRGESRDGKRTPSFGRGGGNRRSSTPRFNKNNDREDNRGEGREEKRTPSFERGEKRRNATPRFNKDNDRENNREGGRDGKRTPSFGRGGNRRGGAPKKFNNSGNRDEKRGENNREERKPNFERKGGFNKRSGNKFGKPFRRRLQARDEVRETPKDSKIRLNKFIAKSGLCSRREADEYIKNGMVEVNGTMITEMGYKVEPTDEVRFDGKILTPEDKIYILLNKPKGFITTTNDERDRKTVMDLVKNATPTRVFPVGRLDRQTTGVLLFTNDGDLTKKLTHPSHNVRKIYHVVLDKPLHGDDMAQVRKGIPMTEGIARVDKVSYIEGKSRNEVGVEIHIGWNRVVRRIFERLGYKIVSLDRVSFAGLTKKNVKRGTWRILDKKEIDFLKMV